MQKFLLLALMFVSVKSFAAGDCQYRFSDSPGELQVIPAGFTGLMTCSEADTKKLLAELGETLNKKLDDEKKTSGSSILPSVSVQLGNLSFYPSLRAEIAKALQQDKSWDSAAGKSKADSMNDPIATAFLRSSFVMDLSQKNLMVDEAGIENIKTAPAAQLKIAGLKGIYPESANLKLVLHKQAPPPPPPTAKPIKR